MEEELKKYKTYKNAIIFELDVPYDVQRSNMNTAIIQLDDLRNYMKEPGFEPEIINNIIESLKQTLENMKYKFL